jgi:hypothetical protein
MVTREAGCSCGQLHATVTGDPIRVSVCHCLACQRRSGGPFGEQARFAPEQVSAIAGEAREYHRRADDDDELRIFRFCAQCGTTVYYTCGDEEWLAFPVGVFADPSFPPPARSVYGDRKHDWVVLPDGIEIDDG